MSKIRKKLLITLLLVAGLLVTTIFIGVKNPMNWLIFVSVSTGLFMCLFAAEGIWFCFVCGIASYVTYIPSCLAERYYGELVTAFFMIVVYTVCLAKWKKNTITKTVTIYKTGTRRVDVTKTPVKKPKNHIVTINKIGIRETVICCFLFIIATAGYWAILNAIGSHYALLNAVCTVSVVLSCYFTYRISRNDFVTTIIYNASLLTLWMLAAANGDIGYLLFTICGVLEIGFALYGFFYWGKLYKKQTSLP